MAKIVLTVKLFVVYAYNAVASIILHSSVMASIWQNQINTSLVIGLVSLFLFFVFLPEMLFLFMKWFREWIMSGVEDGDGELNKSDLKDAGIIYVSLWCMRVFMGFSLAMMLGAEINTFNYLLPLLGSFGIAGLTVLKNLIKR